MAARLCLLQQGTDNVQKFPMTEYHMQAVTIICSTVEKVMATCMNDNVKTVISRHG